MQDKSFQQAIQELRGRLSNGFEDAICRAIFDRTTVTEAASDIQDEQVRAVVTKTLIVGQITVLLTLMKNMQVINHLQYDEFVEYLMYAPTPTYQVNNSLSCEKDATRKDKDTI